MTMNVMFDIDGVLADNSHRFHYIETPGKKNWDRYYRALSKDILIEPVAEITRGLMEMGHTIWLMTGRPEHHRESTILWLEKNGVWYNHLMMRRDGDFSPNPSLKAYLVKNAPVYFEMAFEDDPRSVEALKPLVGYVMHVKTDNEKGVDP
jgi:FMN phosphatase YigB (HAD superfamily)